MSSKSDRSKNSDRKETSGFYGEHYVSEAFPFHNVSVLYPAPVVTEAKNYIMMKIRGPMYIFCSVITLWRLLYILSQSTNVHSSTSSILRSTFCLAFSSCVNDTHSVLLFFSFIHLIRTACGAVRKEPVTLKYAIFIRAAII